MLELNCFMFFTSSEGQTDKNLNYLIGSYLVTADLEICVSTNETICLLEPRSQSADNVCLIKITRTGWIFFIFKY